MMKLIPALLTCSAAIVLTASASVRAGSVDTVGSQSMLSDLLGNSDDFFVVYPHSDPDALATHLYKRELCVTPPLEDEADKIPSKFANINEAIEMLKSKLAFPQDDAKRKQQIAEILAEVTKLPAGATRDQLKTLMEGFLAGTATIAQIEAVQPEVAPSTRDPAVAPQATALASMDDAIARLQVLEARSLPEATYKANMQELKLLIDALPEDPRRTQMSTAIQDFLDGKIPRTSLAAQAGVQAVAGSGLAAAGAGHPVPAHDFAPPRGPADSGVPPPDHTAPRPSGGRFG